MQYCIKSFSLSKICKNVLKLIGAILPELKLNSFCSLKNLLAIRENSQPHSDGISIMFKTDKSVKSEGTELTGGFFGVLFYFFRVTSFISYLLLFFRLFFNSCMLPSFLNGSYLILIYT